MVSQVLYSGIYAMKPRDDESFVSPQKMLVFREAGFFPTKCRDAFSCLNCIPTFVGKNSAARKDCLILENSH